MIVVMTALAILGSDPDMVVNTSRRDLGALPEATAVIETASPSSTVSSATQDLTTEKQISRWLDESPAVAEVQQWRDEEPRRMTGEVSLGIGTGDYSHVSGHVTMPLGETGQLSLGFSQTKNGWMERPMGRDGLFWSPRDEFLGPQWVTPTGRSFSPADNGRSLIDDKLNN